MFDRILQTGAAVKARMVIPTARPRGIDLLEGNEGRHGGTPIQGSRTREGSL
jgi:hypothetical protein